MTDLTRRLRDEPYWYAIRSHGLNEEECKVWHRTCCEAADEIERLTAELKALAEGNIKRWDDSCAMATEIERKDKVIEVLRDEAIDYHDIERVNKALREHDKENNDGRK